MNTVRFETLAEAFGGDVARWPVGEREAAAELMLARPDWAGRVLTEATALDTQLMRYTAPRAATELVDRIVVGAPSPRRAHGMAWLLPVGIGAGLVAASLAGFAIGLQITTRNNATIEVTSAAPALIDDDFGFEADEDV